MRQRLAANLAPLPAKVAHHRRQDHVALAIGQALGHAMAHRSHQRMGGAQVDAHGNAPLVGVRRLARFRNLQ